MSNKGPEVSDHFHKNKFSTLKDLTIRSSEDVILLNDDETNHAKTHGSPWSQYLGAIPFRP